MQELINIQEFTVTMLAESAGRANSYLMRHKGAAWLIDPSAGPEVWGAPADEVVALLATHGHYDHIAAVDAWREYKAIPLMEHERLDDYLTDHSRNVSVFFGQTELYNPAELTFPVSVGETYVHALTDELELLVRYYPGHTGADVVYLVRLNGEDMALFTGDVIFDDSIGRNDLPSGSPRDQGRSLKDLKQWLQTIKPDILAMSGHGPETTVQKLLEENPYLLML